MTHEREPVGRFYTLGEAEKITGIPKQNIIFLINRYHLLTPRRDKKYGQRLAYRFSEEDITKIREIQRLRARGYKMSEITKILGDEVAVSEVATLLAAALRDWYQNSNEQSWNNLVSALSQAPSLTPIEQSVLRKMETGSSFADCAKETHLTEEEVRVIFKSAEHEVSLVFLRLLKEGARNTNI